MPDARRKGGQRASASTRPARCEVASGGLNLDRLDEPLVAALAAFVGIPLPQERAAMVAQTLREVLAGATFLDLDTADVDPGQAFDPSWS
jgi:hypothetical protein